MVLGTPTTGTPMPVSLSATPSVSSPPMATSASNFIRLMLSMTISPPSSSLNGLVRDVPRMVPPLGKMPEISSNPNGSQSHSIIPFQPLRTPRKRYRYAVMPLRTTARMTALRPGQSPPPVNMPIVFSAIFGLLGSRPTLSTAWSMGDSKSA